MTDALAGQIVTGIVTLGVAFLGYLKLKAGQKKVETKVDGYSKQVDGMKTELVEAVRGQAEAEGKERGRVQQRAEAKEDSVTPTGVVDVKIVDQEKEVKVIVEKPDKTKL